MPDYRRLYQKEKQARETLEAEIMAERDARLDEGERERARAEAAAAAHAELGSVKAELAKLRDALAKASGQAETLEARLANAEADRASRSGAEQAAQSERERREATEARLEQERMARIAAERREAQVQRLYQEARTSTPTPAPVAKPTEWRFLVAARDLNGDIAEIRALPTNNER